MGWRKASEPAAAAAATPAIERVLAGRKRDIGGFSVERLLPAMARRSVGPFVFFDRMGPAQLAPRNGMDVRPHPHINLWWNFVSSSRERIEQAKRDWKEGRLGQVPGETEFIPLPEA